MRSILKIMLTITNATLLTVFSFQVAQAQTIPQDLVGAWIARRGSGSRYVDSSTGESSAPNGEVDQYTFRGNGQYEHAFLGQHSLYNCATRIFGREVGSFSVTDSTVQLVAPPGVVEFADTCNPNNNTRKASSATEATLNWRLDQDQYGRKLCLSGGGASEACYYQQ
jgi:hypothetical protein